ncbi:polysaccharide deacetylase family protein [Microlunatus parietis]|uniref:Peptidoglycan/xylan/chitin deacetylase (PgdA/CDA1 family) n=1 Tax=Microlunatus parietis TaxID=682979 RepID=A0A7Y9IAJ8_9ACTN|nr:polysaccharide deacetylase family protein [Microlunatus parietis]NYE73026.1 peptidoglycan/xylan/chitin deacetylase (PgdA/CDA1 family) [Microlunatus parietis]
MIINVCFHGIGNPQRELEPDEAGYWIEPELYEDVLDRFGSRPDVRLSFDDGNASDLELGLPGLLRRGLTAAFFPLAGRLGRPGSLSAADVDALGRAGMIIGSHGLTHRPWRDLDDHDLDRELIDARELLSDACGRPVNEAALPLGRYDRRVLGRLRTLGYRRVFTSDRAPASAGSWLQPRYSVRSDDTVASLNRELLGPRSLTRRARSRAVTFYKSIRPAPR